MGKNIWVLVALVVIVAVYFTGGKWLDKYSGVVGTTSPSPSSSSSSAPGTTVKPVVGKSPAPVSNKSYTELVKEYVGRIIQFDDRCQINPKDPKFKNGTSIMLDNRSAIARTVTVGTAKYDLAGYGYKLITLSSPSLPKELNITCGSSGNVGKILLQATILQ
jgi:hypothetical protein